MTDKSKEYSFGEGLLMILPILMVFVPGLLYMAFPDSVLLQRLFGGWRVFVAIPVLIIATHYVVKWALNRRGHKY